PGGGAQARWGGAAPAPADGADLPRPPRLVAKIEVEPAIEPTDADMDGALGRIEVRLGLDHIERRLQGFRTRRSLRRLKKAARQPAAEALGADRPGLSVAVDVEIGEAGAIRGMGQLGRLRPPYPGGGPLRAPPSRFS